MLRKYYGSERVYARGQEEAAGRHRGYMSLTFIKDER